MMAIQEKFSQLNTPVDLIRLWQNMISGLPNFGITAPTVSTNNSLSTQLDLNSLSTAQNTLSVLTSAILNLAGVNSSNVASVLPTSNSTLPANNLCSHSLYQHGMCAWPDCHTPCDCFATFLHHLQTVHTVIVLFKKI